TNTALQAAAESDFTPGMVFDYSVDSTKMIQTSINAAVERIQEFHALDKIIEDSSKFNKLFGVARAKDQALLSDLKNNCIRSELASKKSTREGGRYYKA
ncbi:unnamed protein product, partial [Mycena citricolor]